VPSFDCCGGCFFVKQQGLGQKDGKIQQGGTRQPRLKEVFFVPLDFSTRADLAFLVG
jgi:hypothetical protein